MPTDGGVIHDGSTTGPEHGRDLVLHQQQHAANVDVADLMVMLDRLLGDEQAELALCAGVVERNVQRPDEVGNLATWVPTIGLTHSDQRHPGSKVTRIAVTPPKSTTSAFPFFMGRVSSGESKLACGSRRFKHDKKTPNHADR